MQGSRDSRLISPAYKCPYCKDTGVVSSLRPYVNPETGKPIMDQKTGEPVMLAFGKICDCRRAVIQAKQLTFAEMPKQYAGSRMSDFNAEIYESMKSRELAVKAQLAAAEYVRNYREYALQGKGLYFWSETKGSGKTMFMCTIANNLLADHVLRFATTGRILEEIKESFGSREKNKVLKDLMEVEILVIDDFGAESVTEWAQQQFYEIINTRYNARRVTMFTSNAPAAACGYNDRITSRVDAMTYAVHFPEESVRGQMASTDNRTMMEKILEMGGKHG